MKKMGILVILALLIPSISNAESIKKLTAEELYAAFEKNEISAERQYKGKEIVVLGEVDKVSRNLAKQPLVTLKAGMLQYVSCRFPKGSTDQIVDLQKGQNVELKCKVNYKTFTTIHLYDCLVYR
jgi:NAD-dependent DNA ligase